MISKINSYSPTFGTRVYSDNRRFNKTMEIAAQKLDNGKNDSISITNFGTADYNLAKGDRSLSAKYPEIRYRSENGYLDKLRIRWDFSADSEVNAEKICKVYNIFQMRKDLVKGVNDLAAGQYRQLKEVKEAIEALEDQRDYLQRTLYTNKFESDLERYEDLLLTETKDLAEKSNIEVYTKMGDYTVKLIKDSCKEGETENFGSSEDDLYGDYAYGKGAIPWRQHREEILKMQD